MKLKDLIAVTDSETLICVCDNMGPLTDVVKLKDISVISLVSDLDRKVERVYIDADDNSLTIILEDWKEED